MGVRSAEIMSLEPIAVVPAPV